MSFSSRSLPKDESRYPVNVPPSVPPPREGCIAFSSNDSPYVTTPTPRHSAT